jgi:hypothetical protein
MVNKCKKMVVTLLAGMMLSVGLAPAAFAGSDNGGAGGPGTGGTVACAVSVGQLTANVGVIPILSGMAADGTGTSCSSFGTGGGGGNS